MKRCLVLTDFQVRYDWEFLSGLRDATKEMPIVHSCTSNWLNKNILSVLKRYWLFFWFPFKELKSYGKFENIIGYQQFYALNLAFFLRLFRREKRSRLYVMNFIYKERKGLTGLLYRKYMSSIINSPYIDLISVNSANEPTYYASLFNCGIDKFVVCAAGIDIIDDIPITKGDYCFSVGRSNRDFGFLSSAFKAIPRNIVIATDNPIKTDSENVKVLNHCEGKEMLRIMAGSFCVIIPLKDRHISAGQLVALQAMQLHKPIIATKSDGLTDYLEDGKNALFMENTQDSLLSCLSKLSDNVFYQSISDYSYENFISRFSLYSQGKRTGQIIMQ